MNRITEELVIRNILSEAQLYQYLNQWEVEEPE
jgi:hypothetical protein